MIRKFFRKQQVWNLARPDRVVETNSSVIAENKPANEIHSLFYLNLSINGTYHCFSAPSDSICYNNNVNASIYFQNAAITKFGWLNFRTQSPWNAGSVELFDLNTGMGLLLYESSGLRYPVTITEQSDAGEYISGHFSGIYTDAKDEPVYELTCSFRVQKINKISF